MALEPISNVIQQIFEATYLTDFSPKDKPFEVHRQQVDRYRNLYLEIGWDRYSARIDQCSRCLEFAFQVPEGGEYKLKLRAAYFCRLRHCPVCQWRKALMWKARFHQAYPLIMKEYPTARFIFLTLTVRNCELSQLRERLAWMNKSWELLTKRKQWPAMGWIKTVEVTRSADDSVHPHFHALLLVRSSYFKGSSYLSQDRWTDLWKGCLKVDYNPIVHVCAIYSRSGTPEGDIGSAMAKATSEVLKYAVKPSDTLSDDSARRMSNCDWLCEITKQLHKTRAVATGGVFKTVLSGKLDDEPESLIHAEDLDNSESDPNSPSLIYTWRGNKKRYQLVDSH